MLFYVVYGESRARVHALVFTATKSIRVLCDELYRDSTLGKYEDMFQRTVSAHIAIKIIPILQNQLCIYVCLLHIYHMIIIFIVLRTQIRRKYECLLDNRL